MGRRKKVVAEATAQDDDAPGPGHNSGADSAPERTELTDDQKQVLYFQWKKKIVAAREQMASLTGELRNAYKGLKADLGITKKEADFALALDNDEKGEMIESHRRMMELARWEQHPIGLQADLFDGIDRTPAVDKAAARGKKDGLAGDPCAPQADPSTPQYDAYMTAFHEGNAELARSGIKAPTAPAANTEQLDAFAGEGLPATGEGAEQEEQPEAA
jgi:hypothetical protein